MGRLDEETLFDVVAKSWLNLHFSVAEGWGYSILEASACGTPTIAYNVPGVNETIINGKNGATVADGDIKAMIKDSVKFLEKPEQWIQPCRSIAEEHTWNSTASLWEKHLNALNK